MTENIGPSAATSPVGEQDGVRPPVSERYRDVLAAREQARLSAPLGDESALDMLAMRDHVLGLEAELVNARAELVHARNIAADLRAELGQKPMVVLLRALRVARRWQIAYAQRRAAARRRA